MSGPNVLTIGAVAKLYGVEPWQVRRLYEKGILPEPRRAGLYRLILASELAAVEQALRAAGYLPEVGDKVPA